MHYTDKDVELLLQEVETNFAAFMAKSEETEKEEKKSKEKEEREEETPPKKEESSEVPKEEKQESKEEPKEEHKEAQPEHKDDDACDYDDEDHAHMQKMYMSMKKGELKAHHDAVKMALDKCGMDKCGEMDMSEMKKSESFQIDTSKFSQEIALLKSEISTEKAKNEKLTQEMNQVEKFVEKLLANKPAPAAKAFTSLDIIQKSEVSKEEKTLSKSEVTEILNRKAQDPSLSKSDRELINQYCLMGGSTQIISHLLK